MVWVCVFEIQFDVMLITLLLSHFFRLQLDRKSKDPQELLMLELLGNGGKVIVSIILCVSISNKIQNKDCK